VACAVLVSLALGGCDDLLGFGPTEEVVVWEDDSFDLRDGPLSGQNGWTAELCSPEVRAGAVRLTNDEGTNDQGTLCEAHKDVPVQVAGRHRLTAQVRVDRFATEAEDKTLARLRINTDPFVTDEQTLQIYVGRTIRVTYAAIVRFEVTTEVSTLHEVSIDIDLATSDVAIAVDGVAGANFRIDAWRILGVTLSGWDLGGEVYLEDLRGIGGL
jgi:hypothetical protein